MTGFYRPELVASGTNLTQPVFNWTDEYRKEFPFSMSDLKISPTVVSPDGKTWKVIPSYVDLNDLPALNDPVWNLFETPEQYAERLVGEANEVVKAVNAAWKIVGYVHGAAKDGNLGAAKPPRYNGAKPKYHVNEKHVKLRKGQNATKLPSDAEDVYKKAVPDDPLKPKNWFGKNKDGVIYRYSNSNDGNAHFSGRSDEGDGVRNMTDYAKERLKKIGNE